LIGVRLSLLTLLPQFLGLGASLDCWFCVGPDCDGPMSGSKFSYTKTCDPGAVCQVCLIRSNLTAVLSFNQCQILTVINEFVQKTIYYIMDLALNVTNATVPIRSCSWNYGNNNRHSESIN